MNLHHPSGGLSAASGLFAFLPPAATPKAFKEALGDEIERMIAMLDHLDGDTDLEQSGDENEPSLGSLGSCGSIYGLAQTWAGGDDRDREQEDGNLEPEAEEMNGDDAGLDDADPVEAHQPQRAVRFWEALDLAKAPRGLASFGDVMIGPLVFGARGPAVDRTGWFADFAVDEHPDVACRGTSSPGSPCDRTNQAKVLRQPCRAPIRRCSRLDCRRVN